MLVPEGFLQPVGYPRAWYGIVGLTNLCTAFGRDSADAWANRIGWRVRHGSQVQVDAGKPVLFWDTGVTLPTCPPATPR